MKLVVFHLDFFLYINKIIWRRIRIHNFFQYKTIKKDTLNIMLDLSKIYAQTSAVYVSKCLKKSKNTVNIIIFNTKSFN